MAASTKTHLYTEITARPLTLLISASSSAFAGEQVELVGVISKAKNPQSLLVRRVERPYLAEILASDTNVSTLGKLQPDVILKLDADKLLEAIDIISNARKFEADATSEIPEIKSLPGAKSPRK